MTLDVFQQIAAMSLSINKINHYNGKAANLQKVLHDGWNSAVGPYIGEDWKLVWGPVVWKHKPDDAKSGPDNSWYVAYHPSLKFEDGSVHPTYVIAVAGTPETSTYVWFKQTLAAHAVSDFRGWVNDGLETSPARENPFTVTMHPHKPYVSTGTLEAVRTILITRAPANAESTGLSLLEFMRDLNQSTSHRIIVTGHSLGGALTPVIAHALVSAEVIPAKITRTYPIAGPSPGNAAFADEFANTFPANKSDNRSSYKGWNLNLVNQIDPVPHFWCYLPLISLKQNLSNIPTLYHFFGFLPILPVVGAASLAASSSGALYKPIPGQYFTGSRPLIPPMFILSFISTVYKQHMDAYPEKVGITIPWPNESAVAQDGATEKSQVAKWFNYPGIANFAWAYENPDDVRKGAEQVEAANKDQGKAAKL